MIQLRVTVISCLHYIADDFGNCLFTKGIRLCYTRQHGSKGEMLEGKLECTIFLYRGMLIQIYKTGGFEE